MEANIEITEINFKDEIYPKELLEIENYPKKLYALGNIKLLYSKHKVGIVGTRKCSYMGCNTAYTFAKGLASNGITIVSGMAIGIDASAHMAAINQIGKTIAVLGSGFNDIFPEENSWLFKEIISNGGCIISEYNKDDKHKSSNFPKRNRIISGLSEAILVIEAGIKSGSIITANFALKQNKRLYAIPGDIYNIKNSGTNMLIYENKARLVTNPSQMIEEIISSSEKTNINIEKISIPQEYFEIYNFLKQRPMHINEISKILKKPVSEISGTISLMEIEGYITKLTTDQYVLKKIN